MKVIFDCFSAIVLFVVTVSGEFPIMKSEVNSKSISPTSPLGPWIVHLNRDHSHEAFEELIKQHQQRILPFKLSDAVVTHRYRKLLHGLVVNGITKEELLELGAERVVPDTKKSITQTTSSWGLDRLDQKTLPLDGIYSPAFDGNGVNVYVVDTGGKTVGVSPNVNLYGCKVLTDSGEGDTSDVLEALEMIIHSIEQAAHPPSVVSMSLGGPCDTDDCQQDSIVLAVEALIKDGVVVSVASGNEACNGCMGSPAAARNAISTGAFGRNDKVSFFSNFGQCVDVYAPGENIYSACASSICHNDNSYRTLSGTSMACPHVTGVIAQLLHKNPSATPHDVYLALSCEAAQDQLVFDHRDTISRDLLLQVPKADSPFTCDLGTPCANSCNGFGLCLPSHQDVPGKDAPDNICHCDPGHYGSSCQLTVDPICSDTASTTVTIDMSDSHGDGWTLANFAIIDSNGLVADNAYDGLCFGDKGSKSYCLEDGNYSLKVSKGYYPDEVGFSMCDVAGGSPYNAMFQINSGQCNFICPDGLAAEMYMFDTIGNGWNHAYYTIFSAVGEVLFGGSLTTGKHGIHNLCLPKGCNTLIMTGGGALAKEASFQLCGFNGHGAEVLTVCVDENLKCTVSTPPPDPSCAQNSIPFSMFDTGDIGWQGANMTIHNSSSGALVASSSLAGGFTGESNLCLADGCYDFTVSSGGDPKHVFWYACGTKGTVPWHAKMCLKQAYGLCYGLTRCPVLLSLGQRSAHQHYFLTQTNNATGLATLIDAENLHGVHELCGLPDGCYDIILGTGKAPLSGVPNEFELCGRKAHLPARAGICTSRNSTSCSVKYMDRLECKIESHILQSIVMIDTFGDGWGPAMKYSIVKYGDTKKVAVGTLSNGEFGVDHLCLDPGCYSITLPDSWTASDVVWLMCGLMGGAPANALKFCVQADGSCAFTEATDDEYTRTKDDDFPTIGSGPPTIKRTKKPIFVPSSANPTPASPLTLTGIPTRYPKTRTPTISSRPPVKIMTRGPTTQPLLPSCSPSSMPVTFQPTLSPTLHPTIHPTFLPTSVPTIPHSGDTLLSMLVVSFNITLRMQLNTGNVLLSQKDFTFVSDACRHALEVAGIKPWTVAVRSSNILPSSSSLHRGLLSKLLAIDREMQAARFQQEDVIDVGIDVAESSISRGLLFGPSREFIASYATVLDVILPLLNQRPFALKEQVDVQLMVSKSDGSLTSYMTRALAVHAGTEADKTKEVKTFSINSMTFYPDASFRDVDVTQTKTGTGDEALYDSMWASDEKKSVISPGAIAGIIIAILVVAIISGYGLYRMRKARRESEYADFRDDNDNVELEAAPRPPESGVDPSSMMAAVSDAIMSMSTRGMSASTRGMTASTRGMYTGNPILDVASDAKFVILEDRDEVDNPLDPEEDVDADEEDYSTPGLVVAEVEFDESLEKPVAESSSK